MNDLKQLQIDMQNEIANERNAEIKAIKAAEKEAEKSSEKKLKLISEHFKGLGVDSKKYEAYNKELTSINNAEIKAFQANLSPETSPDFALSADDIEASSIDNALVDSSTQVIYTSSANAFSTQEHSQPGDEFSASSTIFNSSTQKRYNWAKGAGSGIAGSGAASNTQWVEFGFWFKPSVSRVYSIVPRNVFRGFYIVKADDAWYDSKYAKASVNIWINVKQYNWKGWSTHNVMNIGGDNINRNNRLDTNRSNYHSALLGGRDWAYIRVSVQMYVYARGGGSYAELNFAKGSANYMKCPYCIVS